MNEIILELIKRGISVTTEFDKTIDKVVYTVNGFYKSGTVKLIEEPDGLYVHQRYDQVDKVESCREIVSLNFYWWNHSKDRFDGWKDPDPRWLPLLIDEGCVEAVTETITTIKIK